ncbi:MAG: N-6 DNA methylase [Elusimicrobia bacterium]|nr:N-6 DNA methylase [Elusimicrobiota bacterium]
MPPLPSDLRNKLERAIIDARDVAEAGAEAALKALAVNHHEPFPHQSPEERRLRNHLRAHARQLGDNQDASGRLYISHLVNECAYEHWHRMIFARFLAENDLLIDPTHGVAMSLEECKELADKEKTDLWVYASRCAQQMLPQIFRPDDPLLKVTLAREHRIKLEALLNNLPSAVFKADDSLGWVYQFWQSKKKDEVNGSGEKINSDTLPAVTQLFTEHYMVLFLLHNTLGAWHAGKVLAANPKLADSAKDEDELRRAVALKAVDGYSFDYLRFVRGADGKTGPWRPAAGVFENWPKKASELKVLDPCCGSGHFLAAAFALLFRLRMEEEGTNLATAVNAVLQDNIFGLELDARCTQIAAFNLALSAWKHLGWASLPPLHVACSGIGINASKEQWLKLAKGNETLMFPLGQLWELFQKAPLLGSLINPNALAKVKIGTVIGFNEIRPLLEKAVKLESDGDDETAEMSVTAQGVAKAAEILADHFTLVITNVPYLGRGKQNEVLRKYCEHTHPKAKADLATCFVERCLSFSDALGTTALVTPHSWLFLGTYKHFRKDLLTTSQWDSIARLGPGAFETIGGEVVNVVLATITNVSPLNTHSISSIDVAASNSIDVKNENLKHASLRTLLQKNQLSNPDSCIQTEDRTNNFPLLKDYADVYQGIGTTDNPNYLCSFWEVPVITKDWDLFQYSPEIDGGFSGLSGILKWEQGRGPLNAIPTAHKGLKAYGKQGFAVSVTSGQKFTRFIGFRFDNTIAVLIAKKPQFHNAIGAFLISNDFKNEVKILDQALSVTESSFLKVPFDLSHWEKVAAEKYPHGLPRPFSSDPTQWLFNGHPKGSDQPLHVAVARMLGYKWPRQTGSSFPDCPALGPDDIEKFSDDDGIVCIPSIRGEDTAADRLSTLLAACGINPDRDLDEWLRDSFFEEHCKLFHHRPFILHIWDGRKRDGFHALVNYHKLAGKGGHKLLENLTYAYLGEWISRQRGGVKSGDEGAEDRLAAAIELQKRLESILNGEPPVDIFIRWKPLSKQAIGWEPDINDGIRLNIRPLLASDLPNGRNGAGILRWKPNVKWDKDRGKEPHRPKDEYPWFWNGNDFTGDRVNDCHFTGDQKQKARTKNSVEKK